MNPMKRSIIFAHLMVIALVIIGASYTDYLKHKNELNDQQKRVSSDLALIKADLEGTLLRNIELIYGLSTYINLNPNITQAEFSLFAEKLLKNKNNIKNIAAAKDLIITHMHPVKGNEKAIGLNYLEREDQLPAIQTALIYNKTVLAGPIDLVQGGRGLIARLPVFIDQKNWGFVSIVLDFESILQSVNIQNYKGLNIALKGKDARGRNGDVIYGDDALFLSSDTIESSVRLPFGEWILAGEPIEGWHTLHLHVPHWSIAFGIIFVVIYGMNLRLRNEKLAQEKQTALVLSESRFRNFFKLHRVCMVVLDEDARVIDSNASAQHFYGFSSSEFKGKTLPDVKNAWNKDNKIGALSGGINGNGGFIDERDAHGLMSLVVHTNHVAADNVEKSVEIHVTPVESMGKNQLFVLIFDTTEQRKHEQQWHLFEQVYKHSQEGILVTDTKNKIISTNPAFERITGYSSKEVVGQNPSLLNSGRQDQDFYKHMYDDIYKNGFWRGEIWNKAKSGEVYPQLLSISQVRNGDNELTNYVAVFSDITKQKESEEKLERLAHYDELTGLPNRLTLKLHLEREIKHAKRQNKQCALLFLDLDRFKVINDSLGHKAGDELLCMVGERLGNRLRDHDVLARLGGDEYVILITDYKDEAQLANLAKDLSCQLDHPFVLSDGVEANVGVSIGIAQYPKDAKCADELLKYSDASMYKAKKAVDLSYTFYTKAITDEASSRLTINAEVKKAVKYNEFELLLQPQVCLSSSKIIGAEALIRWHHPEKGYLTPNEFIPLAESTGAIKQITRWVVEKAFDIAERWHTQKRSLRLSINVSAVELSDRELFDAIVNLSKTKPHVPSYLTLEIVESALIENIEFAKDLLYKLQNLGFQIAIDDFGIGFSSLSYLSQLPIDTLKIDRVFVQNMDSSVQHGIVKSVINLASNFNMKVVGEGIETIEHESALLRLGCDYGQGFLYSKAVPLSELESLCTSQDSMTLRP